MLEEAVEIRLKFIGKILSLFTHQLNNHLAIIKDSLGFLEDLSELRGLDKNEREDVLNTLKVLEDEINKATLLSKRLNSFGHRMDSALSVFNPNEVIEEVLTLVSRATIEKKLGFVLEFGPMEPIYGNPSLLQFLLFCLLDRYIRGLPPNGKIIVMTRKEEGAIRILLDPQPSQLEFKSTFCSDKLIEFIAFKAGISLVFYEEGMKTEVMVREHEKDGT